jgi:hypothetical protein
MNIDIKAVLHLRQGKFSEMESESFLVFERIQRLATEILVVVHIRDLRYL